MSDRQEKNTVVVHGMAGDGPVRIFGDGASIVASVGTAAGKSTASTVGSFLGELQVLTSAKLVVTVLDKELEPADPTMIHGDANQQIFSFSPAQVPPVVPKWGDIALQFLLSHKLRKTLPGDLEEEFPTQVTRMGLRGARFWYWCMVVRSAVPLASWSLAYALFTWIAQKFSR